MLSDLKFLLESMAGRLDIYLPLLVLVVLTTTVCCYTGLKRGEIESLVGSNVGLFIVGLVLLLGIVIFKVLAMYLLPILVLVSFIEILILGMPLNVENLLTAGLEPASKLAIVMALGDNLADWLNSRREFSFRRYLLTFSWILFPAYFTVLVIAWILTRVSVGTANSDTVPGSLFVLPKIVSNWHYDAIILTVLVLLIALTFYRRWRKGKPWA